MFLSYVHDSNAPLIEKTKEYLLKDAEESLKYAVWLDTSIIKTGKDWREKEAKLRTYFMNIEPHTELPTDFKEYYHFGEN